MPRRRVPEEHIRNTVRERGEFQLTSARDRLRQEDGFQGLVVEGRRFDIGIPEHFLDTLAAFGRDRPPSASCDLQ